MPCLLVHEYGVHYLLQEAAGSRFPDRLGPHLCSPSPSTSPSWLSGVSSAGASQGVPPHTTAAPLSGSGGSPAHPGRCWSLLFPLFLLGTSTCPPFFHHTSQFVSSCHMLTEKDTGRLRDRKAQSKSEVEKSGPRQRLKGQMSGREEEVERGRVGREGTESCRHRDGEES